MVERPLLLHLTTTDISLWLLLGPQLRAFRDAGYEVVGASAPGPHVAALERSGIRHLPLRHATRSMAPGEDLLALGELARLFRRLRPDIVHTHNPKPGVYGRLAARAAGVPVVVNTVHGLYATTTDPLAKRALVYGLERIAALCSHAELVQNPEDLEVLQRLRVPRDRLRLLGNGIDLGRFEPGRVADTEIAARRAEIGAADDDVVVGLVGRLVVEKGYREVIAAAQALRAELPRLRFVAIGPPEPEKADGLGPDELAVGEAAGIRFLGERADVVEWYRAFDLFVLASWREGFPRAAMEAAAMALPVVATDVRGCRQVVEDGRTGFLVPPRRPEALADAIRRLALDPALRVRMGQAGREKALRAFDQTVQIDLTLATYERLMRSDSRPGARGVGRRRHRSAPPVRRPAA